RLEERLGDVLREHVPDGVLRPERGTSPHRDLAQSARLVVAEAVGHRLEVGDPAVRPERPGSGDHAVDLTGGGQAGLVDRRHLVAQGYTGPPAGYRPEAAGLRH